MNSQSIIQFPILSAGEIKNVLVNNFKRYLVSRGLMPIPKETLINSLKSLFPNNKDMADFISEVEYSLRGYRMVAPLAVSFDSPWVQEIAPEDRQVTHPSRFSFVKEKEESIEDNKDNATIKNLLKKAIHITNPPPPALILGPTGQGKTSIVRQIKEELSVFLKGAPFELYEYNLPNRSAEDIEGYPVIRTVPYGELGSFQVLERLRDREIFYELNPHAIGKYGILFLDEYNRGRVSVLQASMKLLDYEEMLRTWFLIFAGNLGTEDDTSVNEDFLDAAFYRRFLVMYMKTTPMDWINWARQSGQILPFVVDFVEEELNRGKNVLNDIRILTPIDEEYIPVVPARWHSFSDTLERLVRLYMDSQNLPINRAYMKAIRKLAPGMIGDKLTDRMLEFAKRYRFDTDDELSEDFETIDGLLYHPKEFLKALPSLVQYEEGTKILRKESVPYLTFVDYIGSPAADLTSAVGSYRSALVVMCMLINSSKFANFIHKNLSQLANNSNLSPELRKLLDKINEHEKNFSEIFGMGKDNVTAVPSLKMSMIIEYIKEGSTDSDKFKLHDDFKESFSSSLKNIKDFHESDVYKMLNDSIRRGSLFSPIMKGEISFPGFYNYPTAKEDDVISPLVQLILKDVNNPYPFKREVAHIMELSNRLKVPFIDLIQRICAYFLLFIEKLSELISPEQLATLLALKHNSDISVIRENSSGSLSSLANYSNITRVFKLTGLGGMSAGNEPKENSNMKELSASVQDGFFVADLFAKSLPPDKREFYRIVPEVKLRQYLSNLEKFRH